MLETTDRVSRIDALCRRRQANIDTEWLDESRFDKVDERGHKIRERTVAGPGDTTQTTEHDLTAMYRTGPSTTGQVWILRTEAELVADGVDLGNPHIPATEDILEEAVEKIRADGHEPAWEVVDSE